MHNLWHCFPGSQLKSITSQKYCIRDTNQQVLVLQGSILVAAPDKLPKTGETFYVLVSTHTKIAEGNPIFLAVSKGELCLCCEKQKRSQHPIACFKKTNIKELNALGKKESLSFTFLKQEAGSYFTLESAANRGYFIFTYNTPSQPVGVTKEIGKEKNTHFSFEAANVDLKEVKS
uniref:Interleukin-33 n=1 Tax=Cavia porcellus TaxID=10141 RepID=H0W0A7_CAVPO